MRAILIIGWVAFLLAGCAPADKLPDGKIQVAVTTSLLRDGVAVIAGDRAQVIALMGPGIDPHTYKATPSDLARLREADMVIYNGLHLEGKMTDALQKLGRVKPVIAVAERIPTTRLLPVGDGQYDPHIWFDISLWEAALGEAVKALQAADPGHASFYAANFDRYRAELADLDQRIRERIRQIPPENRILATTHDAFAYFGRAYGIEVKSLQGISTAAEYGIRDVSDLVQFVASRKVRAVFVESSNPSKPMEAVMEGARRSGHEVKLGGLLYSDALGATGGPAGTYLGMMETNTAIIAAALTP